MTSEVQIRIDQYKADLSTLSPVQIVRKHIIYGESCILSQHEYFDLRSKIAEHFQLHPNEVLVVGSAKLGFSIVPNKLYCPFHDESDIDVVIVSSRLFDEIWEAVFSYSLEEGYWSKQEEFTEYLFQGWIRPDKLPRSDTFQVGKDWWDFFQTVTSSGAYGSYKIVGALYKSWFFLENYQKICVQRCLNNLEDRDADISNQ